MSPSVGSGEKRETGRMEGVLNVVIAETVFDGLSGRRLRGRNLPGVGRERNGPSLPTIRLAPAGKRLPRVGVLEKVYAYGTVGGLAHNAEEPRVFFRREAALIALHSAEDWVGRRVCHRDEPFRMIKSSSFPT